MSRPVLACAFVMVMAATMLAQDASRPVRVFSTAENRAVSVDTLLAAMSRADVLFLGEDHNDSGTHAVELRLLDGLSSLRGDISLALEMFERDVQEPLDHFQMGHMDEADLLQQARPWSNYSSGYKPIVDLALAKKWPIVAPSTPRAIAADIAAEGLDVLKTKHADDKALFAREWKCPTDDRYFARFRDTRTDRDSPSTIQAPNAQSTERYYFAQCLKDETMGESIAGAYAAGAIGGKRPLIVSINGRFHSDYRQGVVERTARRLPGRTIVTIAIAPVATLDGGALGADDRTRADYVVFVGP